MVAKEVGGDLCSLMKCKNCKHFGGISACKLETENKITPDNSVMIFCSRCEECVYEREGGDGNGIKNY